MNENQEKRMVSDTGYEVKQCLQIGGKEILLAENLNAENGQFYLVCHYAEHGFIGEYSQAITSDDYFEALQDYTGRINSAAEAVQAEHKALNLPAELFTAAHCHPHNYAESIAGKVVAIRADVLSPEYRTGDNQLIYVTHGNGARANPHGSGVYCYQLNSRTLTRYERRDVLGEVKPEHLPQWAKENLARIQDEREKSVADKEFAGRYEIVERIAVGQKVFALGHNKDAAEPYGTWQGYKDSKGNFDYGHYFSSYDAAKSDLRERAAKEQERIARPRRREDGAR